MKLNQFDIRQLAAHMHGYGSKLSGLVADAKEIKRISVDSIGQLFSRTDHLGKPYFMDFSVTIGKQEHHLPNEPLVSLSGQNRIVKTLVAGGGRSGTVKECTGVDDWKITIAGVCINAENPLEYPHEQVEQIKKLKAVRGAVGVKNDLLRLFGIYSMVVESLYLDSMPGVQHAQKYKITALSDEDFFGGQKSKPRVQLLKNLSS